MHRVIQLKRWEKHFPGRVDKVKGLRPTEEKLWSLQKKVLVLSEKLYVCICNFNVKMGLTELKSSAWATLNGLKTLKSVFQIIS